MDMKSGELKICSDWLDAVLRAPAPATVCFTPEEQISLTKLLRVVTGLREAAEEFGRKQSALSAEQRQYLANFNDESAVPTVAVRRGEKMKIEIPQSPR